MTNQTSTHLADNSYFRSYPIPTIRRTLIVLLSLGFLVISGFAQTPTEVTEMTPPTEQAVKTAVTSFINQLNTASDFGTIEEYVADA